MWPVWPFAVICVIRGSGPGRVKHFSLHHNVQTRSTQPPMEWLPGFFPGGGVKRPRLEFDSSPQSRAEVTNE